MSNADGSITTVMFTPGTTATQPFVSGQPSTAVWGCADGMNMHMAVLRTMLTSGLA